MTTTPASGPGAALAASIIRTLVPPLVGAIVAGLTALGLPVDGDLSRLLEATLFAAATAVYYIGVRVLETYVSPRFGWLLGLAKSPDAYSK
ncbi:hypothetical protein QT381_02500 [Galbitalea sp. SE-J8]|uniref:hypothetical protein n=1 Tax=Galbitalea sp. SE-J8 TaxID=3054952 RepID=UPI00259CB963|nr:hypothetical protein [Galbitalea sp. SE-J8]MDM4761873.1 hypothetical protein [Galbitalea sp. SE-J8]